jgi:hypothetical protein
MNIRPPDGSCFVKPLTRYQEQEMMIVIPESANQVRQPVGTVLDVTLYPENQLFKVWNRGKLVDREAWRQNAQYKDLVGKAIVFEMGSRFEALPLVKVRLEHILAILDGDITSIKGDTLQGLMKRCAWCKSQGEGNMLLDQDGYCIKCRRNEKGEIRRLDEKGMPEISDDDIFEDIVEEPKKSDRIFVSMYRGK